MSKIEVNTITQQCGPTLTVGGGACKSVTVDATTVTLGKSGGTVSLAAGATQSGFGRTGTVDWCTTAKTAPFTGVSGKGYFVNTTCGAITVTLPASPSAGDIISIKDYARTFDTNAVTICRNGSKMDCTCYNATLSTIGESATLIYVSGTKGWTSLLSNQTNIFGAAYITATGGTITCCGDYKIHTFTSDGTFSVSQGVGPLAVVDYMVVAGGAGGGGQPGGGGGGAGGYRESYNPCTSGTYTASPLATPTSLPISPGSYPITVGGGGNGGCAPAVAGYNGSNSIFSTITSAGGGGGAADNPADIAGSGGSGGGGGFRAPGPFTAGGAGNTPPVSPPQGNPGGDSTTSTVNPDRAGGGGGAGGAGSSVGCGPSGGPGGNGIATSITGSSVTRAGGGGGGKDEDSPNGGTSGNAGPGGGGQGASSDGSNQRAGSAGTANTGGGGGGAGGAGVYSYTTGYNGGSGIVVIRYKYQ